MMNDPGRRQALEAELAEALQERERLEVVISYLSKKLGRPVPASDMATSPSSGPRIDAETGRVDPVSLVAEGEFFGQTATAAALAVLQKVGRPNALKTDQLVRAARKGGIPVKDYGTLYRSLGRNSKFKRVGKGLWGLSEWYPVQGKAHGPEAGAEAEEEKEAEERPSNQG
jgi:hypothetical protein